MGANVFKASACLDYLSTLLVEQIWVTFVKFKRRRCACATGFRRCGGRRCAGS